MLSTLNTIVNTQCTSLLVFEYEADYKLHSEEHLEIYYVETNGDEKLLDPDSEYSVEQMTDTGFKVILVTSYDEGVLSIRRSTGQQQEADFIPGGDFPAETFERSLDKLTMMVQELREELDRSIRAPLNEEPSDLILPRAEDRADKFVAFNNDGLEVIASEGSLSGPIENIIWDKLQFNDDPPDPSSEPAGLLWWNNDDYALNIATGLGPVLQVGQESYVIVYNNTGSTLTNGTSVYPVGGFQGRPSVAKANALSHVKILGEVLITTMDIPTGTFGISTQFGKVRGIDTSSFNLGDTLWVSDTVDGGITNSKPAFPSYPIQVGGVTVKDAIGGEILVGIKGVPEDSVLNFWNGVFRESFDFLVTSNGTVITGSLSPTNGHDDMTMIFSDGLTVIETTPAITVSLVGGSDSVPLVNYIYIPKTTKVLTVSTSGWPTTEHIKVAVVYLRTASTTQTEGALKNQNWNDHIQNTVTNQGHLSHIGERLRQEHSKWDTGVLGSVSIITASTPDDVYVAVTTGNVYQMHKQVFPALNMSSGDDIHVVNDSVAPYKTIGNLNVAILDAIGVSIANSSFSFVVWGVQNKSGEASHLMLNLPTGSYAKNDPDSAVDDASNYSNYDIPKDFQGVGFLIVRFTFVLDTAGTGWTLYDTQDLRGKIPNNVAGGIGGGGGGAGGYTWVVKTANYSAVDNDGILADTTGGVFTITLPASPSLGAKTLISDGANAGSWYTNNVTIDRNGETIEGASADYVLDVAKGWIELVFDGTTWQIRTSFTLEDSMIAGLLDNTTLTGNTTAVDLTVTNPIEANNGITVPVLHVQDQKTSGTGGGTFTAGAWQTRTLNTEVTNTVTGASISSNQITLPAGTYKIVGMFPAAIVNNHKAKMYNITDASDQILGTSEYTPNGQTMSFVKGIITITGTKVFEFRHTCATTRSGNGFGVEITAGTEVYADVFIERIG